MNINMIDWFQVFLSLGSGVIGSAAGALATIWATRKSIDATVEQSQKTELERAKKERAKDEREKMERVEQAKNWIHAEIMQMSDMVKDLPRNRRFPDSAWESTKMYLYWWKPEEQKSLISLYNEVALYNKEINLYTHNQEIQRNHGGQLTSISHRLKPALSKAIKELKVVIPE